MKDLYVLVPSRGRPENIDRLFEAWSARTAKAEIVVVIDGDDPKVADYRRVARAHGRDIQVVLGERLRLGGILNHYASLLATSSYALGFMGDDHLPRTKDWDLYVLDALRESEPGIVYANDLLQGANLPTQVYLDSRIVSTLGYFVPAGLTHMYLDNSWLVWGRALGTLGYLPEVVVEHVHPVAGKATNDAGYDEANSYMGPDRIEFDRYLADGRFDADVSKLLALRDEVRGSSESPLEESAEA